MVIDRTDFRENIKVEMLSVSKDELLEDFEDAPDVTKSGLYKHAYSAEYGQFGGQPYGAIISDYQFGPGPQDVSLLSHVASVSAMSHAPFVGGAGPEFFGLDNFDGMANLKDLESIFEGPQYAKWQAFRESDDARNVGLALPRFMLAPALRRGQQEQELQLHRKTSMNPRRTSSGVTHPMRSQPT